MAVRHKIFLMSVDLALAILVFLLGLRANAFYAQRIVRGPENKTVCLDSLVFFKCLGLAKQGSRLAWKEDDNRVLEGVSSKGQQNTLTLPQAAHIATICCELLFDDDILDEKCAYLGVQDPPFPPSGLTATPLNETSIKLSWSAPPDVLDEGLISYLVEVRSESGGLVLSETVTDTEYLFTMDNPDPCHLYSFTVTSLCDTVQGERSDGVSGYFNLSIVPVVSLGDFRLDFLRLYFTLPEKGAGCFYKVLLNESAVEYPHSEAVSFPLDYLTHFHVQLCSSMMCKNASIGSGIEFNSSKPTSTTPLATTSATTSSESNDCDCNETSLVSVQDTPDGGESMIVQGSTQVPNTSGGGSVAETMTDEMAGHGNHISLRPFRQQATQRGGTQ